MINIMKYLREFIIGSSAIITIPWFISVNYSIKMKRANYSYYNFTMYSPIRLGLLNVGSAIIADYFGEDVLEVAEAKKYMKEYNEKYEKTIAVDCKDVNKKRNKRLRLVK